MSTTTPLHPLAVDYLERLRYAARALPRSARRDLVAEIEAHLAETTHSGMSNAEVLTVIDRLGDPEEIVEAQQPPPSSATPRRGGQEWAAIFLLLFGGFAFGLGWIAGVVLLWTSAAWTVRDKLIGTLVWPGGLALVWLVLAFGAQQMIGGGACPAGHQSHCVGAPTAAGLDLLALAAAIVAFVGPIGTSIYLARRAVRADA